MTTNSQLDQAVALLRAGRLVAFPTETVYGLGANAMDAAAVRRIYAAKGRPSTSPLIVHVADQQMALRVVSVWPATASALAECFWPGPLTLVLPKLPLIPDEVTAGLPTVGIRIPAHPLALELIRRSGLPLAAPSANRFMQLSPTTAAHVREGLGDAVDLVLDGGACTVGIESTVLSLAGAGPVLLRPGMVSRGEIEAVIGPVHLATGTDDGVPHASPGQHRRHYSPRTPLVLGSPAQPAGSGYLWFLQPAEAEQAVAMPAEPGGYASMLYGALHRLDGLGLSVIYVETVPAGSDWDGVRDRLQRASVQG